uniref:dUTP diphosphatase n=1 Tax=viral metagenome TaxID=1070528 RepID=A0A6C0CZ81_9ZZZZ
MKLKVIKLDENAVMPTRAHADDIGYDLTAIGVYKRLSDRTVIYNTGISVKPPSGKYIEILPRSSLTKTGYMLANSVGTIDPGYTGDLLIAVRKIDDSFPDLEVPFTRFQMVMRDAHLYDLEVVTEFAEETKRGSGGFGSTDK